MSLWLDTADDRSIPCALCSVFFFSAATVPDDFLPVVFFLLSVWRLPSSTGLCPLSLACVTPCECPWLSPPFTYLTNFSTARNATMPNSTHRPTVRLWSSACEWPPWLSCEWPWPECEWPCEWTLLSPDDVARDMIACGMRCRNASPSSPPEAKLSSTFSSGCCSRAFSSGISSNTITGEMLISAVEPSDIAHSVRPESAIRRSLTRSSLFVCTVALSWSAGLLSSVWERSSLIWREYLSPTSSPA